MFEYVFKIILKIKIETKCLLRYIFDVINKYDYLKLN
jgi:hypothetical protein